MAERILVRKIEANLWQWREVTAQGHWRGNQFYTGDINLLRETVEGRAVWLLLSGPHIVSQRLPADIKDRRQLIKVLPFEVEENVIEPIEDMQFAYGPVDNGSIAVAYGDLEWIQAEIAAVEEAGCDVQRCLVDYLMLPRAEDGCTLLLENGLLMAHTDHGVGFAVEQDTAALYLQSLAGSLQPAVLQLYADTEEGMQALRALLPQAWAGNDSLIIDESEAGYWDVIDPNTNGVFDFRTGKLARRLPFNRWWEEWKMPLITTAAAFVVAIGAAWLAQWQADEERKRIMAETDAIYRQAVPSGSITDPERQLRALLGNSGAGAGQSSNAVALLAGVAPALGSMENVKVRNFRYSADNGQLQMNVEADGFAAFEVLRTKIAEAGYQVEIKSANVFGDTHQAQLRVSEAG